MSQPVYSEGMRLSPVKTIAQFKHGYTTCRVLSDASLEEERSPGKWESMAPTIGHVLSMGREIKRLRVALQAAEVKT